MRIAPLPTLALAAVMLLAGLAPWPARADDAGYMAKGQGRNRIYLYDTSSIEPARRHGEMERVARIDRWVVSWVFAWLKANPRHLNELHLCAVNLSGLSLTDNDFHRYVLQQFDEVGIPSGKICFEVTETAAITNLTGATRFISAVKGLGCQVALDDFGSGISSFAYLEHLAVDSLKIDGVLVKDIVDDPIDYAMVKSIDEIAPVMGKKPVGSSSKATPCWIS